LISYPGVIAGEVQMETSSDLLAAGVLFRKGGCAAVVATRMAGRVSLSPIAGTVGRHEALVVTDPGGSVTVGTTFDILEEMSTWNEFHGGDLGLQWWTHAHGWTVEVLTKIAVAALPERWTSAATR